MEILGSASDEDAGAVLRAAGDAAWALADQGRWHETGLVLRLAQRVLARARDAGVFMPERVWFDVTAAAAVADWRMGKASSRSRDSLRAAIAQLRAAKGLRHFHARAVFALGLIELGTQQHGTAVVSFGRAYRLASGEDTEAKLVIGSCLALARFRNADWRHAHQQVAAVQALAAAREVDGFHGLLLATASLWPNLTGDKATGEGLTRQALLQVYTGTEHVFITEIVVLYAQVAAVMNSGNWSEMQRLLQEHDDSEARVLFSSDEWTALWAIVLRNTKQLAQYRTHLNEWSRQAEASGSVYYWAHVGLLAQHDDAPTVTAEALEKTVGLLESSMDPLGRGWSRLVVATLTSLSGRVDQGVDMYETARNEFTELGAVGFANRTNEILQATARLIADQARDPLEPLTTQQRTVAGLIAEGYTSAEIASILHVSKKTVDFHAANIIERLGLKNRRQIRGVLTSPTLPRRTQD